MSNHALNHNNFQPYTQIKYLISNSNVKHFCPNMTFRIFTLARRLPDGARMLIRIISWRSTIQNWRLKIEHVQRIKVDRDDSPILVEWTLASWATCLPAHLPALILQKSKLKRNKQTIGQLIHLIHLAIKNYKEKIIAKLPWYHNFGQSWRQAWGQSSESWGQLCCQTWVWSRGGGASHGGEQLLHNHSLRVRWLWVWP